jgi:hypothetical protein
MLDKPSPADRGGRLRLFPHVWSCREVTAGAPGFRWLLREYASSRTRLVPPATKPPTSRVLPTRSGPGTWSRSGPGRDQIPSAGSAIAGGRVVSRYGQPHGGG